MRSRFLYVCRMCDARFHHFDSKQSHLETVHGQPKRVYSCYVCGEIFNHRKRHRAHFKMKHSRDCFECVCGSRFAFRSDYDDHRVSHEKKEFICEKCGKMYRTRRTLGHHRQAHVLETSIRHVCGFCDLACFKVENLRYHIKKCHPNASVKVSTARIEDCHKCRCGANTELSGKGGIAKGELLETAARPSFALLRRNAITLISYSTACPFKVYRNKFVCPFCDDRFQDPCAFREHVSSRHENADVVVPLSKITDDYVKIDVVNLKCRLCNSKFDVLETLAKHLTKVHDKIVKFDSPLGVLPFRLDSKYYSCVCCDSRFSSFAHLNRHMLERTIIHSCSNCGSKFMREGRLRAHLRFGQCPRKEINVLKDSMARQNAEIILKCSTAFPFRTWLHQINCVFCRGRFVEPGIFRYHMSTKHTDFGPRSAFYKKLGKEYLKIDITDLKCKLCTAKIDNVELLMEHLKNMHQQPIDLKAQCGVLPYRLDAKDWSCVYCNQKFTDFENLNKHTPEHLQNFVCDSCGRGFITESALRNHKRIPHENSFHCYRCIETFSTSEERKRHMKVKHKKQPYICNLCENKPRFCSWDARRRHLITVHKIPPKAYECEVCKQTFKSRSTKSDHVRKVHSDKQYPCTQCNAVLYRFTSDLPSTSRGASGPLKGKLHAPSSGGLFMTRSGQLLNPRLLLPQLFKGKPLSVSKTLQIPRKGITTSNPPKILSTKNQSFRLVSQTVPKPQISLQKKPPTISTKMPLHFYQPRLSPRQCAEIILKYSTACPFRSAVNVFHCKFCSDHFLDPALLRKHYKEEHQGVNLAAAFYRLRDDYLTIDVTDLKCKVCHQDMTDVEALLKHLKDEHKKSFILEESVSSFGVIPFKLDVRNWKCTFCSTQFSSFVHLNQHVPSHLSNYVCDSCGAGFISHRLLNNHIRLTHSSTFPCHRCKATFQTLEERKNHIKTQHNPQPYTCYACKERPRFSSWYVRLKHLQEVHNHKPMKYECVLCSETFTTRAAKYSHIRKVHTEPQQRCTFCEMVFHTKTQLKYHMVKHSDERPFKCNVCQKDFNRKKTLTQHMRIHTNDRRYVCHLCSQAFIQKCSLNNHLKVHHPSA
ncbi:Zinc finger protein 208 [Eumeta japonica]|uniref:Zinc finger protein 208 n=1 Tax=Eumeta variegata TaxID=151549 RepID=A0A4C1V487_EUMVA|nr:Zinc finger protein 208 [Eumeta japonica]